MNDVSRVLLIIMLFGAMVTLVLTGCTIIMRLPLDHWINDAVILGMMFSVLMMIMIVLNELFRNR